LAGGSPDPAPEPSAYLTEWFLELHAARTYSVAAGLGGGMVLPGPLTYQEIRAWALLTDSQPEPWEVAALRRMDREYLAARNNKSTTGRRHQQIGEHCQGAELDACRRTFGEQLERVCSTCPN
jgi:hypothetical protein